MAQNRNYSKKSNLYLENHHIIPRSINGNDDSTNLVLLTAREHFIAHLLLAKIYKGSLIYAAWSMSHQYNKYQKRTHKINSHTYNYLKEKVSKLISVKMSLINKGVPKSKEHKNKIRLALQGKSNCHKGIPKTKQHIDKILKTRRNNGKPWHSSETKFNISNAIKNLPKLKCPICNKLGSISNMKRWHFNNCKFIH